MVKEQGCDAAPSPPIRGSCRAAARGTGKGAVMVAVSEWKVPSGLQPRQEHYTYDLNRAFSAVVGLRAVIAPDAFTAETLGTERAGNGVVIRESGLILTIGYLITEAETVWLHLNDGRVFLGHVLAYDQATGFGLVQPLAKLDLPALPLGD